MSKIITALIFFLAAIVLGFFYTFPAWQKFGMLGSDVAALATASVEFDQLIANRDNLLNLINSITKDNLARLDQMFPQGAQASDFLVAIEALTTESTIALRRIDLVSPSSGGSGAEKSSPQTGQPRPTTAVGSAGGASAGTQKQEKAQTVGRELPFSLQIAGSYENFKKFLMNMERNLRLIDVDEISFSATGKKDESTEFTLKAKTYYQ
ncbi:MAG: type 4a pilus biogenesis protein PilO [Candidatus Sungiibacteriota bacterium]